MGAWLSHHQRHHRTSARPVGMYRDQEGNSVLRTNSKAHRSTVRHQFPMRPFVERIISFRDQTLVTRVSNICNLRSMCSDSLLMTSLYRHERSFEGELSTKFFVFTHAFSIAAQHCYGSLWHANCVGDYLSNNDQIQSRRSDN